MVNMDTGVQAHHFGESVNFDLEGIHTQQTVIIHANCVLFGLPFFLVCLAKGGTCEKVG